MIRPVQPYPVKQLDGTWVWVDPVTNKEIKMNLLEIFKQQLDQGATDQFFYGLETDPEVPEQWSVKIERHRGTLDTFPTLTYVRMLSDGVPLFRS